MVLLRPPSDLSSSPHFSSPPSLLSPPPSLHVFPPSSLPIPPSTSKIATAFKKGGSNLDQIYAALSSSPEGPSLDIALFRLPFRLSEPFVLKILHHIPHHSIANNNNFLRLKFFDWSGRQPGYRHSRCTYHTVFRLLSRVSRASIILNWLHLFFSTCHHLHRPFISPSHSGGGGCPRFHDILVVVGYVVAGRPKLSQECASSASTSTTSPTTSSSTPSSRPPSSTCRTPCLPIWLSVSSPPPSPPASK